MLSLIPSRHTTPVNLDFLLDPLSKSECLSFELLCWAYKPEFKGKLIHQLNRDIYKAFNAAGIIIPFPQRDVHLIKDDDVSTVADDIKKKQAEPPP